MILNSFFRPIFFYRKYVLAEKILKACSKTFFNFTNSPSEPNLLTEKTFSNLNLVPMFINKEYSTDTSRLIEAVDILEKNNHVIAKRYQNLYEFTVTCTKQGEIAFKDGYYRNKITNIWIKVLGIPSAVTILIGLLKLFRII